jgi:hypothetical protein
MSNVDNERALESLVSQYLVEAPHLRENELFWKLVAQCAGTIAFLTEAGKTIEFFTSQFSFPSTRVVYLMLEEVLPVGIYIEEPGDGRFHVYDPEFVDHEIDTDAALLACMKRRLAL